MHAHTEIGPTARTFASGLLLELLAAIRSTPRGALLAVTCTSPLVADDLERWARLTGNTLVHTEPAVVGTRFVIRCGEAPAMGDGERPIGSRLWLYTNFDCNLACDYCCVRSSPTAARRELGLDTIRAIAAEAPALGVREIYLTGGEPTLLPSITAILDACSAAAPTTMLTNGLSLKGKLLESMRDLPRGRVVLQISLDSPTPPLHDLHRGAGTWSRAWRGARAAREAGFRVRLAATVSTEDDERAFHAFLDREAIAMEDRVVRRVALRGAAEEGIALSRADLVPEVTITARGVYWHPVGADDEDMRVTASPLPLASAFDAMRDALARERLMHDTLASVFHCA